MNFLYGRPPHHLGATLSLLDVQPKKRLHDAMENTAGKLALAGLRLVQDGALHPARSDDAVRLAVPLNQVEQRRRTRRAVGVHVTDQISERCQLEALD